MRKIFPLLLSILLVACNLPRPGADLATVPATEPPGQPCAYQWATQPLPKLSSQVESAMQSAGMEDITVIAEAYGEICSTGQPGVTDKFTPLETDFRLTVKASSLADKDGLGKLLEKILIVLDKFPVGTTPGPQLGYVGVAFQSDDQNLNLWFLITEGKAAREQGLHGAVLFELLQNK